MDLRAGLNQFEAGMSGKGTHRLDKRGTTYFCTIIRKLIYVKITLGGDLGVKLQEKLLFRG